MKVIGELASLLPLSSANHLCYDFYRHCTLVYSPGPVLAACPAHVTALSHFLVAPVALQDPGLYLEFVLQVGHHYYSASF